MATNRVKKEEALSLPLAWRVAWTATCVERALSFYSPHAAEVYPLNEVIALAWRFAEGDHRAAEAAGSWHPIFESFLLCERPENYPDGLPTMGEGILAEIRRDDGTGSCRAVGNAETCYAAACCFRQGVHHCDRAVPDDYYYQLCGGFADYARHVFKTAREAPG